MLRKTFVVLNRIPTTSAAAASAATGAAAGASTAAPNGQQQQTQQPPKRPISAYAVKGQAVHRAGSAEEPVAKIPTRRLMIQSAYQAWMHMMALSRKWFPSMVDSGAVSNEAVPKTRAARAEALARDSDKTEFDVWREKNKWY